jgi:hypothetical protein
MVYQCPYVINQILLQTFRNIVVIDFNVHMQKLVPCFCPRLWLNQIIFKFPLVVIEAIMMLCLNDYVVHDHTHVITSCMVFKDHVLDG